MGRLGLSVKPGRTFHALPDGRGDGERLSASVSQNLALAAKSRTLPRDIADMRKPHQEFAREARQPPAISFTRPVVSSVPLPTVARATPINVLSVATLVARLSVSSQ